MKIKNWRLFNEGKIESMLKTLDEPIELNIETDTNPVEHKMLMKYFMAYSFSQGFDKEDRLFLGNGIDDNTEVRTYITKDDLQSLMSAEEKKIEAMCINIDSIIDDVLIDSKDIISAQCSLNTFEYKTHDLITISIVSLQWDSFIINTICDRVKMLVELLSESYNIFKIILRSKPNFNRQFDISSEYSISEFERLDTKNLNIRTIQIHVVIKQKILEINK